VIEGVTALRDAYRDENVAARYIENRFREPLGALLHARQARALRDIVRQARPRQVLEVAPGPARLTLEVARVLDRPGTVIDASPAMLAQARRRLDRAGAAWHCVAGDAFALPVDGPFDLVYSFRLIRHFERPDRQRLYGEIARVLRPGGLFVFDAVNAEVSEPIRAAAAPGEYEHFDALLRLPELNEELREMGFAIASLTGVQYNYTTLARAQVLIAPRSRPLARAVMEVVDRVGGAPLEWIVTCRRA
jgi:ubiquinone/menaquinone biosynthesis C-methylase UbiE